MLPTMLDNILDKDNLNEAYKQVIKNKGAAGVDGMTIDELWGYLVENRGRKLFYLYGNEVINRNQC